MKSSRKREFRYILFNKPFGVLSRFTREHGHLCLADFGPFPSDVYSVGRLDLDSEGLLLLTNDSALKHRMTDPSFEHPRTYWAQVEGIPSQTAIERIRTGVVIEGKRTKRAEVNILEDPKLWERAKPIRFRKNIPTSWVSITLREGLNRQVRKMTAAAGHPTLRLIRVSSGAISLGDLEPGKSRDLSSREVRLLKESLSLVH